MYKLFEVMITFINMRAVCWFTARLVGVGLVSARARVNRDYAPS